MKNLIKAAVTAIVVATAFSAATPSRAASVLHEFDDRAILEFTCRRSTGIGLGGTTAVATLTQQFGGSVNYVSAVIVPANGMRTELLERDIPARQPARIGRIFLSRHSSATINGYFLGISGAGNPIRYSIPENLTVICD